MDMTGVTREEAVLFLLSLKLLADCLVHSLMGFHLLHLCLLKFVHELLEFLLCLGQLPLIPIA